MALNRHRRRTELDQARESNVRRVIGVVGSYGLSESAKVSLAQEFQRDAVTAHDEYFGGCSRGWPTRPSPSRSVARGRMGQLAEIGQRLSSPTIDELRTVGPALGSAQLVPPAALSSPATGNSPTQGGVADKGRGSTFAVFPDCQDRFRLELVEGHLSSGAARPGESGSEFAAGRGRSSLAREIEQSCMESFCFLAR